MERDFLCLNSKELLAVVKEEINTDGCKKIGFVKGSEVQWPFSDKVTAVPHFMTFKVSQEDKTRKIVSEPLVSSGYAYEPSKKQSTAEIRLDSGYPQMKGFLGPYKGERYHLSQFQQGSQPTGYKEVFNQAHSYLQSVIERTFGVWKKIWKILRDMTSYPFSTQVKIVLASMTLHNCIRRHATLDRHFDEIRDNSNYCANYGLAFNNYNEDQTTTASNSEKLNKTRDLIAASLMET